MSTPPSIDAERRDGASPAVRNRRGPLATAAGCSVLLALVVGTQPLYRDNQNTYLVRAVASWKGGPLTNDALVRSADPTRAFTTIAELSFRTGLGEAALFVMWAVAAVGFFVSLWWATTPRTRSSSSTVVWAAGVAVLLAPAVATAAERVRDRLDIDLLVPAGLFDGVAYQYALGRVAQPSIGAVAMVAAVAVGVRRRNLGAAVGLLWLGALLHPTYLVSAWMLLGALVITEVGWDPRPQLRRVGAVVGLAMAATAVVALANLPVFEAIGGPDAAEGNEILALFRVPNHSQPGRWFGLDTVMVLVVVVVAAVVARRSRAVELRRLGHFLGVSAGCIVAVSAVVAVVGSHSLELLFPWRASVVVVPLATSSLLAAFSTWLVDDHREGRWPLVVTIAAAAVLAAAVVSGMVTTRASFRDDPADEPVIAAVVRAHPEGEGLVPTDQEDLRLNARVPVYADLNNNPNEPSAIVAWRERLRQADAAMTDSAKLCALVRAEGFGWVVFPEELAERDPVPCLEGWTTESAGDLVLAVRPSK